MKECVINQMMEGINPIINSDFPDPDIIRVENTYYMASTTMFYMPGCDILQSFDLIHWEFVCHAYDTLTNNEAYNLCHGKEAFGKGMWAPSLRYHKGIFYITFASNDLHQTILLTADCIKGPWKIQTIDGFFYDNGLFFDEDDRVYIVHGQGTIRLTELCTDLSGPKQGGLNRVLVIDETGIPLGYEGSHLYKYQGYYYLFSCHFNGKNFCRKTQDYFVSKSLEDEFVGKCLIDDDMGYRNLGVAQGGLIDTPDGNLYAFMFQDRGAIGRAPVLMPLYFKEGQLSIGESVPHIVRVKSTNPDYQYMPLNGDDDFLYEPREDQSIPMKPFWQFSHNPRWNLISVTQKRGALRLRTEKLNNSPVFASNVLTQRCYGSTSNAIVTVDASAMLDGDFAGICVFMNCYAGIAITRKTESYYLVVLHNPAKDESIFGQFDYQSKAQQVVSLPIKHPYITLRVMTKFDEVSDSCSFAYQDEEQWIPLGTQYPLYFKMDFFTGSRFGLFYYATKEAGGYADFMKFKYLYD